MREDTLERIGKEKTSQYWESVESKTNVIQALIDPSVNPVPCGSNKMKAGVK